MISVRRTASVLLRSRCPAQVASTSYSTRSSSAAFLDRLDFLAPAQPQPQLQQQKQPQPPPLAFQHSGFDSQPPQRTSERALSFPPKVSSSLRDSDFDDLDSALNDTIDTDDHGKKPLKRAFNKNTGSNDNDTDFRAKEDDDIRSRPVSDRARRDEEIGSQWIQYISLEGNMGLKRLSVVLQSIDRSQYFLTEVNSRANPPICKLVSKKELYRQSKSEKQTKKANELSKKELQLNWGTDPHDLDHKLAKFKTLLEKGYRVEVQISGKKGKSTTQQERDVVFEKVKAEFEPVAKYVKHPEWIKPSTVTMLLHGIIKPNKKQQ